MTLSERTTAELLAEKAKLESDRVAAVKAGREKAGPINAELTRRARVESILYYLRNNLKPKGSNLALLAKMESHEIDLLEATAKESAKACKAKNPAWRPHVASRSWDLMDVIRVERKAQAARG